MAICINPEIITAYRSPSKPNFSTATATMTVKPAAGPETLNCEPLTTATTSPPTIPAITPAKGGAPEAKAIPRQSGKATRKTTSPAGMSSFIC